MPTNFDLYMEKILKDPKRAEGMAHADAVLDVSLQLYNLREKRGMTQADLAKAAGTTQQVISRIESSGYENHSRRTLEKIASALGARIEIRIVEKIAPSITPASPAKKKTSARNGMTKISATSPRKATRTRKISRPA